MPFYEPDVVAEAKKLDLLTYLQNYEPQELVHVSGNVYCTKTHDSLRISNGKWCWFSQGIGGKSALDYLIKVNGYSFLEAMERIVGQAAAKPPVVASSEVKEKPKTLLLPEKYRYAEYAASYLEKRGISWELISFCISTGRLYESNPYHNVVFVGFDKQGKARFACQRGIYDSRFHGDVNGSDKHFDTAEQLSAFQSGVESQIQEAVSSRKALYRKLRTKPVMQDEEKQAEIKAEISALSGQLKELRREVRLCEDIAVRSQKMRDKMKAAREEEKSQGKEQHDLPEQQKSRN